MSRRAKRARPRENPPGGYLLQWRAAPDAAPWWTLENFTSLARARTALRRAGPYFDRGEVPDGPGTMLRVASARSGRTFALRVVGADGGLLDAPRVPGRPYRSGEYPYGVDWPALWESGAVRPAELVERVGRWMPAKRLGRALVDITRAEMRRDPALSRLEPLRTAVSLARGYLAREIPARTLVDYARRVGEDHGKALARWVGSGPKGGLSDAERHGPTAAVNLLLALATHSERDAAIFASSLVAAAELAEGEAESEREKARLLRAHLPLGVALAAYADPANPTGTYDTP